MRALVTGWFSFEDMGGSAGDIFVRDVVASWLERLDCPYDVAMSPRFGGGLDVEAVDPARYTHLIFACGPLGAGEPALSLFEKFAHAKRIGVNLSMLHPVEQWNPFHLLLERDSDRQTRPDLALLARPSPTPVVGRILVHEQKEYAQGRHAQCHDLIRRFLAGSGAAVVPIDTCLDPPNTTGLSSAEQIDALIGRMDLVVTTRLHGMVLALRNGVPAVAVDPVAGGAKIKRQAEALAWPLVLTPEELTPESLARSFEIARDPATRALAARVRDAAITRAASTFEVFSAEFQSGFMGEGPL